jgi:hypothetical protein
MDFRSRVGPVGVCSVRNFDSQTAVLHRTCAKTDAGPAAQRMRSVSPLTEASWHESLAMKRRAVRAYDSHSRVGECAGIDIERIEPAHPEQNGRHERMHLTLKQEATKPAAKNLLQQQQRFDRFLHIYNQERPQQAIGMKYPAEIYVSSSRPYKGLSDLEYLFHDRTITVTHCGRICIGNRKINLSTVFAGQNVGIKEVSDRVWLVSFMHYNLGFFDHETGRITSAENPFGAKVLPMCPAGTIRRTIMIS